MLAEKQGSGSDGGSTSSALGPVSVNCSTAASETTGLVAASDTAVFDSSFELRAEES